MGLTMSSVPKMCGICNTTTFHRCIGPTAEATNYCNPRCVDKMSEWCNSLVLVCKLNEKVRYCLDPARLKLLNRPVHGCSNTNCIFPKLTCEHYLTLINASSDLSHLEMRWKVITSNNTSRRHAPKKIDKIFKEVPNVFVTVDHILLLIWCRFLILLSLEVIK